MPINRGYGQGVPARSHGKMVVERLRFARGEQPADYSPLSFILRSR